MFRLLAILLFWLASTGPTVTAQIATAPTNLVGTNLIRAIGPGHLELGLVRINQTNRSITVPAEVNMKEGLLEYFLVTTSGKTHESLFRTKADPLHIQIALLLLDAKAGEFAIPKSVVNGGSEKNDPVPINDPSPVKLSGQQVLLEISWESSPAKKIHPAEALLQNAQTKKPVADPKWIFNGSRFAQGKFMGQVTGSIVSLITDPDAIVNNQAKGHENDEIWESNARLLPQVNTPVLITIRVPYQTSPNNKLKPSAPAPTD